MGLLLAHSEASISSQVSIWGQNVDYVILSKATEKNH